MNVESLIKYLFFDTVNANTGQNSEYVSFWNVFFILSPAVKLFKRFKIQWHAIIQVKYEDALSNEIASSQLLNVKTDIIDFSDMQFMNQHSKDDYRELLELILIFLGKKNLNEARWVLKVIYILTPLYFILIRRSFMD